MNPVTDILEGVFGSTVHIIMAVDITLTKTVFKKTTTTVGSS